jgi:hypothetical protein
MRVLLHGSLEHGEGIPCNRKLEDLVDRIDFDW